MTVGENIKRQREEKAMTQYELANAVGLKQPYI